MKALYPEAVTRESCLVYSSLDAQHGRPAPNFRSPISLQMRERQKSLMRWRKNRRRLLTKCAEHNSCDHVYFIAGLLGLYESRESASKYFEKVIAVAPRAPASASKLWIQFLEHYAGSR